MTIETSPARPLRPGEADAGTPIDIAVVGGGLGGLLAAVDAARRPTTGRVVLFEPHPLGGRARCDERSGFTFNRGPRAIYRGGPADRLLTELGIDTSTGGPPSMAGAGATSAGQVHLLPQGAASALRSSLLTPGEKLTFARSFLRASRTDPATVTGRSVAEWLDDLRLEGGPRQLLEALVRVSTYVHAPTELDAGAALANVQAGTSAGVRYLDGGWQVLVDEVEALAASLGVERVTAAVTAVRVGADGGVELVAAGTAHPEVVPARSAIVAVGLPEAAAALLGTRPTAWATLGPPVTAACLELGVRRPPTRRFVLGIDEPTYLSTHAPPARLAPPGQAVVHLLRYQAPGEEPDPSGQRELLQRRAGDAGIEADDQITQRFLASMTVMGGLPLAAGGGLAGRPSVVVDGHPGVCIVGDWVGPTGLLLDAVAASAAEAAAHAASRSATMART